jgi:hypothetical protein
MKAPEVEKRSKKERERGAKKETERGRGSFCSGYETTRTSKGNRVRAGGLKRHKSTKLVESGTSRKWLPFLFIAERNNKGEAKVAPFSLLRSFSAESHRIRSSRSTWRRGKRFQSPRTRRSRPAEVSPKGLFFDGSDADDPFAPLRRSLSSLFHLVFLSHFTSKGEHTHVSTGERSDARINGA